MNYKEAVENVKTLARTYQSVIDLAGALDELASLDQAVNERQNALIKLDAEIADKTSGADSIKDQINKNKLIADSLLSDAKLQAETIIRESNEQGNKIISEAAEGLNIAKDNCRSMIKDAEIKANDLNKIITSKTEDLLVLNEKITKAQAKINEMLAG